MEFNPFEGEESARRKYSRVESSAPVIGRATWESTGNASFQNARSARFNRSNLRARVPVSSSRDFRLLIGLWISLTYCGLALITGTVFRELIYACTTGLSTKWGAIVSLTLGFFWLLDGTYAFTLELQNGNYHDPLKVLIATLCAFPSVIFEGFAYGFGYRGAVEWKLDIPSVVVTIVTNVSFNLVILPFIFSFIYPESTDNMLRWANHLKQSN